MTIFILLGQCTATGECVGNNFITFCLTIYWVGFVHIRGQKQFHHSRIMSLWIFWHITPFLWEIAHSGYLEDFN